MNVLNIVLLTIYLLNFACIIILLFFKRKNPNEKIAWLLALSFLPVVGFILYMLFGRGLTVYSGKKHVLKEARDKAYSEAIQAQEDLDQDQVQPDSKCLSYYSNIIDMFYNTGKCIYTHDNDITLFTDAKDKYYSLIRDIENARESINMLYFIIKNDDIGKRIVNLLTEKAAEGVEVRVIYDGLGSFFTPGRMFKKLKQQGGKVCRFFPVSIGYYLKINHRNHRKIVVIDGEIGYMGGMNIGNEYMGLGKVTPWRDTHLRITGSAVWMLQERFLLDWNFASKQTDDPNDPEFFSKYFAPVEKKGNIGMQIVSSDPGVQGEQIKYGLLKMLYTAKKSVYLQTPYFVPDAPFLEAIKTTAASGVDVRVMIPGLPDKKYVWNVTMSYVRDLLDAGVKVYMTPGFIHAKMVVMDDKVVSIGTTNIDIRSFVLHFEVNAFIYDGNFAVRCQEVFEQDQAESTLVTREWYESRGILTLMKESFYRLFSPLM